MFTLFPVHYFSHATHHRSEECGVLRNVIFVDKNYYTSSTTTTEIIRQRSLTKTRRYLNINECMIMKTVIK